MDWRPKSEPDDIVALGLVDGKIVIKNVTQLERNNVLIRSSVGKDFSLKHTKTCTDLEWNREKPNWLATGFEKAERSSR